MRNFFNTFHERIHQIGKIFVPEARSLASKFSYIHGFAKKANDSFHDFATNVSQAEYLPESVRNLGSRAQNFSKVLNGHLLHANNLIEHGKNMINSFDK
jgi:hypothetical protein